MSGPLIVLAGAGTGKTRSGRDAADQSRQISRRRGQGTG